MKNSLSLETLVIKRH